MSLAWSSVKALSIPVGGVSRDVKRVTAGGVTLWEKPNPVPYDAEVEYIESTGTQYIDTGYVPTSGSFAVNMTALTPWTSGFLIYFGAYISNANRFYATNVSAGTTSIAWQYGKKGLGTTAWPNVSRRKTAYTFPGNTHPFFIFYQSNSPTAFRRANARFQSAQFWDSSGTLVCDYMPVRVGSGANAVGYLYDRANPTGGPSGNGLYPNSGTGAFVVGPDKS